MLEIDVSKADVPFNAHHDRTGNSSWIESEHRLPYGAPNNVSLKSEAENIVPHLVISNQSEGLSKIDKPGNYSETLMIDGTPRRYNLHVPPQYDPSRPEPLVLVLHGHGDDAAGVSKISGMDAEADKKGFIVAYPEAMQWLGSRSLAAWDTGNGLVPPGSHVDDGAFLRKVIEGCQNQLSIDPTRTYLVGFSNGGMEAYKAATELSDKLAAVVAVSGAMGGAERKPALPVSLLSVVGTSDDVVPFTGRTKEEEVVAATNPDTIRMLSKVIPGLPDKLDSPAAIKQFQERAIASGFVPEFKPLTYATDFWKSADGISGPGISTHDGGISSETYTNPETGVAVEQEIVTGGDHMVQHGAPSGFNLADEVWKFLDSHPKTS